MQFGRTSTELISRTMILILPYRKTKRVISREKMLYLICLTHMLTTIVKLAIAREWIWSHHGFLSSWESSSQKDQAILSQTLDHLLSRSLWPLNRWKMTKSSAIMNWTASLFLSTSCRLWNGDFALMTQCPFYTKLSNCWKASLKLSIAKSTITSWTSHWIWYLISAE